MGYFRLTSLTLLLTADDMHMFFLKWNDKFPEFKSQELFLIGESYASVTKCFEKFHFCFILVIFTKNFKGHPFVQMLSANL